jgi:acyl-CoA synthetase (NDP forming)
MEARLKNLDYAFNPRSIAFVGATETMNKWGFLILNNMLTGGYEGEMYPVNPSRETILGMKAYPTVRDIPSDIDLAVFTVPSHMVINALDDCIAKGVKAGVVITAGFRELGGEGTDLEAELLRKGHDGGIILIGPNCQGICCPANRLYTWMPILYHPPQGKIAYVSQSGNILNMLIGFAVSAGFGVSKAVSSGNEADVRTEDYFSYYAEDPDTDVIVSYVEGVNDGRSLLEKAREVTRHKPIVILKGGRTQSGISAARSHTGAMAVSDQLFESACRQAGVILTRSIDEASVTAAAFVNRPLPRGKRVGIITGGGGLGVIGADFITEMGLEIPELSSRTLSALGELMPNWWVPGNPIDLVAGLDFGIIKPAIEILMKSGEVDSVMFLWIGAPRNQVPDIDTSRGGIDISMVWGNIRSRFTNYSKELYDLMQERQVPLYLTTSLQQEEIVAISKELGDRLLLLFPSVELTCQAISNMVKYHEYLVSLK